MVSSANHLLASFSQDELFVVSAMEAMLAQQELLVAVLAVVLGDH